MAQMYENKDKDVSISQKGSLATQKTLDNSPTTDLSQVYTVPTGKKWIIKSLSAVQGGATSPAFQFRIAPDGVNYALVQYIATPTSDVTYVHNQPNEIEISAGGKVAIRTTSSSAGTYVNSFILYQEFDA